ncbi:hypothetical protein FS749_003434 [Ceratobasidium sp. UAMH 11750]|nr:hypothetical protein FS749_003434 [Ceratobasidium sp. UAMH 11750]
MSQSPNSSSSQALVDILPDSILSDIFLHVKSACTGWDHQIRTPFALATVSRRWRTIALSTSRLWDFLDVLLPNERATTHLVRSSHAPMKVWLDIFHANMNTTTLTNIFHARGTDIWTRAYDLGIMLDYERPKLSKLTMDTLNGVIDAGHHGVFQKITIVVVIDCFDPDEVEPDTELCLYLPDSPILRSLCLEQVALSLKHLSHVSSLPLLQELELKRIYIDMEDLLFPLLSLVPNLVKLSLDSCDIFLVPVPAERPKISIPLSKLEKLTLRKTRSLHSLNILFKTLEMPHIRTLKFGVGPTAWVFPPRAIDRGVVFRHHTLEKLELEGFSPEIMEDLVKHIDKLDNLKKLEVLSDDPCDWVDFPFDLANKLLWTSHCPVLQEVQLPWNEQLDPDSWETLKNLKTDRPSLHIYLDMEELECSEEESVMEESDSEEEQDPEEESLVEEEGEGEGVEEEGGDAEEEDDTGSDYS